MRRFLPQAPSWGLKLALAACSESRSPELEQGMSAYLQMLRPLPHLSVDSTHRRAAFSSSDDASMSLHEARGAEA